MKEKKSMFLQNMYNNINNIIYKYNKIYNRYINIYKYE